jgi:hypothetical protein
MFPMFPVLFPVCSQFSANASIVFPAFLVSAARAINAVFCIRFLQAGNTGNSENSIAIERFARKARRNRRGTTGNRGAAVGPLKGEYSM